MQPSYQSGFYAPGRGVAKHPELWRGCVGAWNPGLGNTGLVLRDWSGGQNNGTLTLGPTWGVSGGRQALTFDGVNDYVNCGAIKSIQASGTVFSSCAWIYPTTNTGSGITSYRSAGGNGWVFGRSASGELQFYTNGWKISSLVVPLNGWSFVALVYDGALKFYLNSTTDSVAGTPGNGTGFVSLGAWDAGSYAPAAALDDTRIYNRALSPQEIRTLAQRPGIAYELAPRKTYFIPTATSTSQFYDVLSPLIFAGTN